MALGHVVTGPEEPGGVVGMRLVRELQGYPRLSMELDEDSRQVRKSTAFTRSFGKPVTEFEDVMGAVATSVSRAAGKLRREGSAVRVQRLRQASLAG